MILLLLCLPSCSRREAPASEPQEPEPAFFDPHAPRAATDPEFWDLSPDADWMSDYPIYACPTPDADDTVINPKLWALKYEGFLGRDGGPELRLHLSGTTFGVDNCEGLSGYLDYMKSGVPPHDFDLSVKVWERDFQPGALEGLHTFPRHDWDHRLTIGYSNGEVWRALTLPEAPAGSSGDSPYQDVCFVRVRPHRVVGVWRVQAPAAVFAANRWPEELWGGLYIWWDLAWGQGQDMNGWTCFYDDYLGIEPQQIWPDWPKGWQPEDTVKD